MLVKNVQHEKQCPARNYIKKTIKNVLNLFSEDKCIF